MPATELVACTLIEGSGMAFTDFTSDNIEQKLGVKLRRSQMFSDLRPVSVPTWLTEMLAKTEQHALLSEKSRSEFIVAPTLVAVRELSGSTVAILSGQRLDVDSVKGLTGECDFILVPDNPIPILQAPLLTILEAKKHDIETGQCVAQMVAARAFNEKTGIADHPVFGCVTTGEAWQFLRLIGTSVELNPDRFYLDNLGGILAALLRAVGHPPSPR